MKFQPRPKLGYAAALLAQTPLPRLLPNNTAWAISLILFLFIWPVVYGIDTREFEVRGTRVGAGSFCPLSRETTVSHREGQVLGPRAAYLLPVGL
jgi:hypothetical protein